MKVTAAAEARQDDDIASAIRALTDEQWARLHSAAGHFAWVGSGSAADLLQETFCRALGGSRRCPPHVDLVHFLIQAMRSIASGEAEKTENRSVIVPIVQPGPTPDNAVDLMCQDESPEEKMLQNEQEEQLRQDVFSLFPGDRLAHDLVDGILAGYEGEELRTLIDLDPTAYASKRRAVRRTINKHIAGGTAP